jgi:phenylalanyl-tRNA synthetase alpha chain
LGRDQFDKAAVMNGLEKVKELAQKEIAGALTLEALEAVKVAVFGKKGELTLLMQSLRLCTPEERKEQGQALNVAKEELIQLFEARKRTLEATLINQKLTTETLILRYLSGPCPKDISTR